MQRRPRRHHLSSIVWSRNTSTTGDHSDGADESAQEPDDYMVVMDGETTKLNVPLRAIAASTLPPTGNPGSPPHPQQRSSSTPTLCRLYLQGRCRQHERCHQVHADPSVIAQLREHIRRRPPCCCIHTPDLVLGAGGAMPWGLPPAAHLVVDASLTIPLLSTAPTRGLLELYRLHGSLALECSSSQFCRNHQPISLDGTPSIGAMCRFGDSCRYLHVCRHSRERLLEDSKRRRDDWIRLASSPVAAAAMAPASLASHCIPPPSETGPPVVWTASSPPLVVTGAMSTEVTFRSDEMLGEGVGRPHHHISSPLQPTTPTSMGSSSTSTAHDPYHLTLSARRRIQPPGVTFSSSAAVPPTSPSAA